MSRTHKPVRLNRGGLTGEWSAVRVNQLGVITDRWPLHPDDAALLERWRTTEARLAAVEALTDTLDADLAAADPAHFSIGLMRGRVKALLAALSAAPTNTTKER